MSVLLELPCDLVKEILGEWVVLVDLGTLDSALVACSHRDSYHQVLKEHISVNAINLKLQRFSGLYRWIFQREISLVGVVLVQDCFNEDCSLSFEVETSAIKEIHFDIRNVSFEDCSILCQFLTSCPVLKKLRMDCLEILPLMNSASIPSLEVLQIDVLEPSGADGMSYAIDEHNKDLMAAIIKNCPSVTSVDITIPLPVELSPIKELLRALPHLTKVSVMSMYNGFAWYKDGDGGSGVTVFECSHSLDHAALHDLLSTISTVIEFKCGTANPETIAIVLEWLRPFKHALTKLDITGQFCGAATTTTLLSALPNVLSLHFGNVKQDAIIPIVQYLNQFCSIHIVPNFPLVVINGLIDNCPNLVDGHFTINASDLPEMNDWTPIVGAKVAHMNKAVFVVSSSEGLIQYQYERGVLRGQQDLDPMKYYS